MKKKTLLYAAILIFTGVAVYFLSGSYLFGQTKDGWLFVRRVTPGFPVKWEYRHSVMKTHIEEYLAVNETCDGLILHATKYQSMGVGLPFSEGDGHFRQEGPWFILDDMERPYPTLSLRNGVSNDGVLTVGDTPYRLAELMPLGTELYLYVAPLYKGFWMKKVMH